MKPTASKTFIEQIYAMGQAHVSWVWNASVLRRAAHVILQLSIEAEAHFSELIFSEPEPPAGETRTRSLTREESAALVDSNLWSVSVLLLAFALENLLKANLVKNGKELVNPEGVLQERFKTHNLGLLAADAGLDLSEDDLETLDGLSAFLQWRGRYPIPTKWERLRDLTDLKLGSIGQFREKAFALYDRVSEFLKAGSA